MLLVLALLVCAGLLAVTFMQNKRVQAEYQDIQALYQKVDSACNQTISENQELQAIAAEKRQQQAIIDEIDAHVQQTKKKIEKAISQEKYQDFA